MPSLKDRLDELTSLEAQVTAVRNQIAAEYDNEIQQKLWRYLRASGGKKPDDTAEFDWNLVGYCEGQFIDVSWEETWSRGGHDSGAFRMPLAMLLDDCALEAYEKKMANEKAQQAARLAAAQQEQRRQRYLALKKEFEP